ncbi:MAG: methyltransferase domain-containing protein [candidate division WOR-3 bacterium]
MKEVQILFDDQYKLNGKNLPKTWLYENYIENFYLINIINSIKPKLILDAGCGVGLKLENLKKYNVLGFDYSFEAVKICKNDKFKVVQASIH